MARFYLQRLLSLFAVLAGTLVLVFLMLHLTPGDPARALVSNRPVSAETYERLRAELGLDEPLPVQFLNFAGGVLRGDFGSSHFTKRPVLDEAASRFPITLRLMIGAMLVALALGLPAGIVAAARFGSFFDFLVMSLATLSVSMPGFWVGLMLILVFSVHLGWLPVAGVGDVRYYILPSIALGTGAAAILARLMRSNLVEVMRSDYVRTARAKGVAPTRVMLVHAFRNAFIPVLTVIGLQVGSLLAGAVVIETVFALPGLGRLLVQGVSSRDYPLVQGLSLLIAATYVIVNFIVDLLYSVVNPRIRYVD